MTDNQLRELMERSPQEGARALFDEYCGYVHTIAVSKLRGCGTKEDIEECVSDVFAEIFRKLYRNSEVNSELKAYIGTVAKNTAIDAYRRISSRKGLIISIDDENTKTIASEESVEENAAKNDIRRIVLDKIHELGTPDSSIIIQQFFYNMTAEEIACSTGLSAAAVRKRSSRARVKLKKLLEKVGIEEGIV